MMMMMMLMGEGAHHSPAPPWGLIDGDCSPEAITGYAVSGDCSSPYLLSEAALGALQRYLPSNDFPSGYDSESDTDPSADAPVDAYSCDEFRMYEFKVRRCARGRSHDWTECPYAHPGEKARRRDPRKYHYSGSACPDFRKGNCKRGDACEFAHGVFECWLHPARYRTQPCKDGTACRRRVCFFAHTPEQLRVLPQQQQQQQVSPRAGAGSLPESYDGSPIRMHALDAYFPKGLMASSPVESPPSESPPVSPSGCGSMRRASWPVPGTTMNEVLASLRQLQLNRVKSMPNSWGVGVGGGAPVFGSPRAAAAGGFCSMPSTPTRAVGGMGGWMEGGCLLEGDEGVPAERVESGRALRARMFERLSKESGLEKPEASCPAPDVGWVSELVM